MSLGNAEWVRLKNRGGRNSRKEKYSGIRKRGEREEETKETRRKEPREMGGDRNERIKLIITRNPRVILIDVKQSLNTSNKAWIIIHGINHSKNFTIIKENLIGI